MEHLIEYDGCRLYRLPPFARVERYIASTPGTRAIANDPMICGTDYTDLMRVSVTLTLSSCAKADIVVGEERNTSVLHILRGGLNYGLRGALKIAYGWKRHCADFLSSQRDHEGDVWYVKEKEYKKVEELVPDTDLIFGDVVATGVSLENALLTFIPMCVEQKAPIRRITFFTIGGQRAEQLLATADVRCRKEFPGYQGARVIYFEGIFGVADKTSPLRIAIPDTDLLRHPAVLAPEFVASQAESLSYPLERCSIYDAGSRAFKPHKHLEDVHEYWTQVLAFAKAGTTYLDYLQERFPTDPRLTQEIPAEWKTADLLSDVARKQMHLAH
ncbi:hypothetical protein L0Y59_01420 [Candidatus Uhrbacteria bacterium]|nr:hypothetical protein [Candidatus Uhrbacteria bacterium]